MQGIRRSNGGLIDEEFGHEVVTIFGRCFILSR